MFKVRKLSFLNQPLLKKQFNFSNHQKRKKSKQNDYSKTLNLPNFGNFELSMKKIIENEDKIKKLANFDGLYEWQEKHRSGRPMFTLHDGPPYANGDIHMGHMVNKVLKDIYLRYKLISGFRVNYIPGWDCHGLPIELSALKSLKSKEKRSSTLKKSEEISLNKKDPMKVRNIASNHAKQCIEIQMNSFKKMNLLADWNKIYRTVDIDFICNEIDLFYSLYEKKLIYREYMPVYWSISSQTALAESELEYNEEHKSEALYVAFKLIQHCDDIKEHLKSQQTVYAPIWTTTPWSLPCNKAIAYNPNLKYGLLSAENDTKLFLIESELIEKVKETVPYFNNSTKINALIDGDSLKSCKYISPFMADDQTSCNFYPSDHVGSKLGTGLVHIAPALGQDDFKLAIRHNLSTDCAIDELGRYSESDKILTKHNLSGKFALDVDTTNQIKSILSANILHHHTQVHSYPYDWRTKKPCIIRSSMQWFIDTKQLKEDSLNTIEKVGISPANVKTSMVAPLSSRPYWCISRQRYWGLPIPCFYDISKDKEKKKPLINKEFIDRLKSLIRENKGIDFWWSNEHDSQLLNTFGVSSNNLQKSSDIFDIWFDSGSSFNSVLKQNSSVADLYCEGVDQFTGWFQSSLLLSIALNKQSPYKNLLVHGFVVDENNRKMSKSIGNVIEPSQAIHGVKNKLPQAGLDALRFWVAHEYYKQNIQIGCVILEKMVKRTFEIRSVVRYVVGNLSDLNDLSKDLVPYEKLMPTDKLILSRLSSTVGQVTECYETMNLNKSLSLAEKFVLTQLSSFYIRAVKDRLYYEKSTSLERRSAQTALYHILVKLLLMLAPVLPHLAEEAFYNSILGKECSESGVEISLFRSEFSLSVDNKWTNKTLESVFELVDAMCDKFNKELQANNPALYNVVLNCDQNAFSLFEEYRKQTGSNSWLVECFGCAEINLNANDSNSSQVKIDEINYSFSLELSKVSERYTCPRCRRFSSKKESELCTRCNEIVI